MSIGTLHFAYITLGSKCLWLIRELGLEVDLQLVDMKNREHKSPAYMAMNPHGTCPTMVLPDGRALWESGAILYDVLDNYDVEGRLKGAPGSAVRTQFHLYQSFNGEAEATAIPHFIQLKMMPEAKRNPAFIEAKRDHWNQKLVAFYEALIRSPDQPFAVGDAFSAVDIAVTYPLHLAQLTGLLDDKPALVAYVERMRQRPHFRSAFNLAPLK